MSYCRLINFDLRYIQFIVQIKKENFSVGNVPITWTVNSICIEACVVTRNTSHMYVPSSLRSALVISLLDTISPSFSTVVYELTLGKLKEQLRDASLP